MQKVSFSDSPGSMMTATAPALAHSRIPNSLPKAAPAPALKKRESVSKNEITHFGRLVIAYLKPINKVYDTFSNRNISIPTIVITIVGVAIEFIKNQLASSIEFKPLADRLWDSKNVYFWVGLTSALSLSIWAIKKAVYECWLKDIFKKQTNQILSEFDEKNFNNFKIDFETNKFKVFQNDIRESMEQNNKKREILTFKTLLSGAIKQDFNNTVPNTWTFNSELKQKNFSVLFICQLLKLKNIKPEKDKPANTLFGNPVNGKTLVALVENKLWERDPKKIYPLPKVMLNIVDSLDWLFDQSEDTRVTIVNGYRDEIIDGTVYQKKDPKLAHHYASIKFFIEIGAKTFLNSPKGQFLTTFAP